MISQESDRRKHDRRPLRTVARVVLPNNQAFEVRTLDIGAGGMGILAGANPKPGTGFVIQLMLPSKTAAPTPFQAKVRVANSVLGGDLGGFKIGLQFVDLEPATDSLLRQYLS